MRPRTKKTRMCVCYTALSQFALSQFMCISSFSNTYLVEWWEIRTFVANSLK